MSSLNDGTSDFSMESSDNNSSDGENADAESNSTDEENDVTESDYDIWEMIDDEMIVKMFPVMQEKTRTRLFFCIL